VRQVEPSGVQPSGMAADLSGGVLYVADVPTALDTPVSVTVLDASTLESIGTVDLGVTDPPSSLFFDPVTCELVTSGRNSQEDTEIRVVDPAKGSSRSLFVGPNWGVPASIRRMESCTSSDRRALLDRHSGGCPGDGDHGSRY